MKKLLTVIGLAGLLYLISSLKYTEIYEAVCQQYAPATAKGMLSEQKADDFSGLYEESSVILNKPCADELPNLQLYALSACLMDAESGRVLYSKNAYDEMAMASTTKIMTLLIALEYGKMNDIVTISSNAARQPDVQLNINTGEQYYLGDLVYSLMLESHNDVAVAIAEHVGGSVEEFCNMMTAKAKAIGALHTSFKTPNGLDADGHYTTAADLALIGSYAIQRDEFNKITNTQTYQFNEITKGRSFTVDNKDRFLSMMNGALGIKTGFTGKAGYCFVGALKRGDRTFVSVVLASGWPPNKNYKWTDTRKLMELGLDNYTRQTIFVPIKDFKEIPVFNGKSAFVSTAIMDEVSILLSQQDSVEVKYELIEKADAPVYQDEILGSAQIYVNQELFKVLPITTKSTIEAIDFAYCFENLLQWLFH